MKITKLETCHIRPRWLFLKISTDEGVCGWGEPVIEGKSTVVEEAVHALGKIIVEHNPLDIEQLWQMMYRGAFYRGGAILTSAISGIEQALWDIKGKVLGVPVWQLLGGKCRDKIRMYAHITPVENPSPQQLCQAAREKVQMGYDALKTPMRVPVRHIDTMKVVGEYIDKFAALRECVGKEVDIAIDFHGRVSPAMASIFCRELEPYYPMFVEEPVLPENVDVMARVASKTNIPIATGERLFTPWAFRDVLEKKAAIVLQPDLCHCGGILSTFKIAAMAANYYASIAPHNPLGPIALASCLQLDTCIPNFTAQENIRQADGTDLGVGIFREPIEIKDGYVDIPRRPGLGIEIIEENLKEFMYDGSYPLPLEYYPDDGSVADW